MQEELENLLESKPFNEGLMGSYDHIYYLAGLKKILEKYPLEES